jgi:hypothetical protein
MDLISSSTTLAGPPMLKSSVETELLKDSLQEVLDHLVRDDTPQAPWPSEDIAVAVPFLLGPLVNGSTGKPSA